MKYGVTANEQPTRTALPQRERFAEKQRRALSASSPVYLLGGSLFAALALFGLFSGFFLDAPLGRLVAGGEPIFRGSLFGVIIEIVRGSIPLPAWESGLAGLPFYLYIMSAALGFSVLLELALSALSFARPKGARRICFFNGGLTVLAYGVLLLAGLVQGGLSDAPLLDRSVAVILLAAVILLGLLSAARGGGAGFLGWLYVCCSLLSCGVLCLAPFPALLDALFRGERETVALLTGAFALFAQFNLLLSLLRLGKRCGSIFELLRYLLQFALSLALFILLRDSRSVLSALFLLLPSALGGILAILARVLRSSKKREAGRRAADPMNISP